MKVIIESAEVFQKDISKDAGKPFVIRWQEGLLDGARIRGECHVELKEGASAYPPGSYEIDLDRSISFGKYGRVEFRLSLKSLQQQVRAA
jgi:hypothetical protein